MRQTLAQIAKSGAGLELTIVAEIIARACPPKDYKNSRVLLIVPDSTLR